MRTDLPEDVILGLPVDELALRLLAGFGSDVNRWNLAQGWKQRFAQSERSRELLEALAEAYDWLAIHGFVAIDPEKGGEWAYVTRRGRAARDAPEATVERVRAEARLSTELHPSLERKVRRQFVLGEFELAAFAALKEVEVRVRKLARAESSLIGVALVQQAFAPEGGRLTDPTPDKGERVALMNLFAGALGLFKNPVSHRAVDYADPTEAAEIVLLADLLMRLLDRVEGRLNSS